MGDIRNVPPAAGYAERLDAERRTFAERTVIHDLPPIHLDWVHREILPDLSKLGYSGVDSFFIGNLHTAYERSPRRTRRFISLGAGNCDTEVRIASALLEAGATDFIIDCLDLNEQMLKRGRALAAERGVDANIYSVCGDFNAWEPSAKYEAVLASQSLHHVVNLEALFEAVHRALDPSGALIISDMIGRNGHRRWPEALGIVQQFWQELPEPYRYNHQLRTLDIEYPDWDCSTKGFEGIRAQDILPLLIERFQFQFFFAFANVIDPFVDRSYGPNFDPNSEWDRLFIDRVHACDEAEILAGRIKPTHMLAVVSPNRLQDLVCMDKLTPEFCVRYP
jgi:SAM-dependent methyltransferase